MVCVWNSHKILSQNHYLCCVRRSRITPNSVCVCVCVGVVCAGVSASGPGPLLTQSSLERAVGQLTQQTASLEALLSALESEQKHTMQEV